MKSNNVISFIMHTGLAMIGFFIMFRSDLSSYSPLYSFVSLGCYCYIGYSLLSNQGSKWRNLLSVSSIAIFGVLLAVFDYFLYRPDGGFFVYFPGLLSFLYNIPLYMLFDIVIPYRVTEAFGLPDIIHFLWLPAVPCILLWVGLEIKVIREGLSSKGMNK